jgi:hypothetical protein
MEWATESSRFYSRGPCFSHRGTLPPRSCQFSSGFAVYSIVSCEDERLRRDFAAWIGCQG